MKLSEKLEVLRERSGLSAREAARRLRTPTTTFGRWLSGETEPRLSESAAIADLFGVPLGFLADDALDEPPPPSELPPDERTALGLYREIRALLGDATALRHLAKVATLAADGGLTPKHLATQDLSHLTQPKGVVGRSAEQKPPKKPPRDKTG